MMMKMMKIYVCIFVSMQAYKTFLEDTIFFFLFQFQFSSSRSHLLASFHLVRVSSKFYKTRHTLQLNKYKQTKICKKMLMIMMRIRTRIRIWITSRPWAMDTTIKVVQRHWGLVNIEMWNKSTFCNNFSFTSVYSHHFTSIHRHNRHRHR